MVLNLYWPTMSNEANETLKQVHAAMRWVASLIIAGTLMYVGNSVNSLNVTAGQLNSEIAAIKERLNKLDGEIVTRREYEARLGAVELRLNEIRDGKVRPK